MSTACPNCGLPVGASMSECPECGAQLASVEQGPRTEAVDNGAPAPPAPSGGSRTAAAWRRAPLQLFAALITLVVIAVGTAGLPQLTRNRVKAVPKIAPLENVVEKLHDQWFSERRTTNANYAVFLSLLAMAVLAAWQTSRAALDVTGQSGSSTLGLCLAVLTTVALGLFAARLRMEIFRPAGRLEWMMNGMSFAGGVLSGLVMNWRRG